MKYLKNRPRGAEIESKATQNELSILHLDLASAPGAHAREAQGADQGAEQRRHVLPAPRLEAESFAVQMTIRFLMRSFSSISH